VRPADHDSGLQLLRHLEADLHLHRQPAFFVFCSFVEKNSRLDLGAEVTHLGAIGYGAEVRAALPQPDDVAST
jgi:hypothetical protein